MVFWKYQGKDLKSVFCSHCVQSYRRVVSKVKPSKSWSNFRRWPPRSQNLGCCSVVFPRSLTWKSWRGWTIFWVFYLFFSFCQAQLSKNMEKYCFWRILQEFEFFCLFLRRPDEQWTYATGRKRKEVTKPCVTSVTIILFENVSPKLHVPLNRTFVKDQKPLMLSEDHGKACKK